MVSMAKAIKPTSLTLKSVQKRLSPIFTSNDSSLVAKRFRELDTEFTRQTKQLAALTKRLQRKVSNKLLPPKDSD